MIKRVVIYISIVALAILCFVEEPYASTDLPVGHWVYDALEDLAMLGMTEIAGLGTRPISRMAVAWKVAKMIEKVQDNGLDFSVLRDEMAMRRAEKLLYRLMDEFEEELIRLAVEVVIKDDNPPKMFSFRRSDPAKMEVLYASFSESSKKQLNLENKRGWILEEEVNARLSLRSWASFQDILGLSIEPVFYGSKDRNKVSLDEASANINFMNIVSTIGRMSLRWGPGYHGAMLLSNNTRPLYLAKVGSMNPFKLPYLEKLGLWCITFFTAKLIEEETRAVKEPYLSGLRVEFSPFKRLNLGATHTIMWGGEGVEHVSTTDFFDMFLSKLGGGADEDENHLISFTGEWAIPGLNDVFPLANGALLYCEIGAEDERDGLPSDIGGLGGLRIIDLFMIEDLDFVVEYARTENAWYAHHKYKNGYTSRGNILGHHVGADGDDIFIGVSKKFGEQFTIDLWFDGERHGLEKSVIEKKYEGGVNFKLHYLENLTLEADYEMEYFDGYNNISGQTNKNHIVFVRGKLAF